MYCCVGLLVNLLLSLFIDAKDLKIADFSRLGRGNLTY